MSAIGAAALAVYGIGCVVGFVLIARWVAADEAQKLPSKTDPAWMNGGVSIVGALFWPVIALGWLMGRLYVVAR